MASDDDANIAIWRTVCPDLFKECEEAGISHYVLLNSLQCIERGQLTSVDEAREQVFAQHKERRQILERMRAAASQRPGSSTSSDDIDGAEDSGTGEAGAAGEPPEDHGELPAWIAVREELIEGRERVWHALATQYMPHTDACVDLVDSLVRELLREQLGSAETASHIEDAVRGEEGKDAAVLLVILEPVLTTQFDQLPKQLATCVLGALPKLKESAVTQGILRPRLVEAAADALQRMGRTLAEAIAKSKALPLTAPPSIDAAFIQDRLESFGCCVCGSTQSKPVSTHCGHSVCGACFEDMCKQSTRRCPVCRESFGASARYIEENSVQSRLITQLQQAQAEPAALDLAEVEANLTCGACHFVLSQPVSTPTGHCFCRSCFGRLTQGDGTRLKAHIGDERTRKFVVSLRNSQKVNVALAEVVSSLFPAELARVSDAVRARAVGGGGAARRPATPQAAAASQGPGAGDVGGEAGQEEEAGGREAGRARPPGAGGQGHLHRRARQQQPPRHLAHPRQQRESAQAQPLVPCLHSRTGVVAWQFLPAHRLLQVPGDLLPALPRPHHGQAAPREPGARGGLHHGTPGRLRVRHVQKRVRMPGPPVLANRDRLL